MELFCKKIGLHNVPDFPACSPLQDALTQSWESWQMLRMLSEEVGKHESGLELDPALNFL